MTIIPSPPGSPLRALLEASANSPLEEATPDSLNELMRRAQVTFNKKPLELSEDDIATNVLFFRSKRSMFAQLAREKENADSAKPKRGKKSTTDENLAGKSLADSI